MIEKIVVFIGSKRDFEEFVNSQIHNNEETIPFMELIQHYNARLRPNESGVSEDALFENLEVDNCIVRSEDYGSVLSHVLANFANIISLNYEIGVLYVHNPPKLVIRSLQSAYPDSIIYKETKYKILDENSLKDTYKNLCNDIYGQENCKKQIIGGLYRVTKHINSKPAVMMLYGPSGVGKTETAKCLSRALGGELLRIQFSMMQTTEAYNYIFGAEHSRNSFARDMLSRETNVILIDEFDKVNPTFYNAFYELFDEGRYVDTNYTVELHNAIFICTGNFASENEIKKALGPAMFSRFGCCIKFDELNCNFKIEIIKKWYKEIVKCLNQREKDEIEKTHILEWFISNVNRYNNIRILKTKLENAIFEKLSEIFIIS